MSDTATATARRLAEDHNLRFVDLTNTALAPGAASIIPEGVARHRRAVPMGRRLGTPVIAIADPSDIVAMDDLRAALGREFFAVVAREDQIDRAIDRLYSPDQQPDEPPAPAAEAQPPRVEAKPFTGAPQAEWPRTPDPAPPEPVDPGPAPPAVAPRQMPMPMPPTAWTAPSEERISAPPPPPVAAPATEPERVLPAVAEVPVMPPPPPGFGDLAAAAQTVAGGDSSASSLPREAPPLARVLVEAGRVSEADMLRALQQIAETGESLARYLFNLRAATEDDLVWAMAQEVGLEFVDLNQVNIDRAAVALIPQSTAEHHMVLPIAFENGVPVVAMANPTDVFAMDDLRTIMGTNFKPVVATRSQLVTFNRIARDSTMEVSALAQDAAAASSSVRELESIQSVVEDAPIIRYVNLLILQALNERASDIHIEPKPDALKIMFRIDGVMHEASTASSAIAAAVVSRLKVIGDMDITEHRIPQEGRVTLTVSDRQIDLRLQTLPSVWGETVVMRVLDKSQSLRSLPELGFAADTLDRFAQSYKKPYGVIVVTGPTGAGKTTTLYSTLIEILSPAKSVVTVEDPVEYQIDGATQVQINAKAGLTWSTALKSILRADPDIVLIGEIRTSDTATIAMEAALSGHLVLTTLHTNTAAATPLRLTEMGIEPFLVTSAVGSVLTQRLARVLCTVCKEPYAASEKDFFAAGYSDTDIEGLDTSTLHRAVGCRTCGNTGYIGRMVLAEVMNVTEEIDRMIIEQDSIESIERKACEQGMRTLRADGLMRAVQGHTTLEEVLRVVM
ncbi:MAG: ATPase, T2SS/T4P/T4SS family [Acidimicrobiales bacterium]